MGNAASVDDPRLRAQKALERERRRNKKFVFLAGENLTDAGVLEVAKNFRESDSLGEDGLWLSGNQLSDHGAVSAAIELATSESLTTLDFSENLISGDGAMQVAREMRFAKNLANLNLSRNNIDGEGAVHVLSELRHNPAMRSLNFEFNPIDVAAATQILKELREPGNINLVICSRITWDDRDSDVAFISVPKHGRALEVDANGLQKDPAAKGLAEEIRRVPQLTTLCVRADDGSDAVALLRQIFLLPIATVKGICIIAEQNLNAIDVRTLARALIKCPQLGYFELRCGTFIPDAAIAFAKEMRHCKTLKHFRLEYCRIGPKGAAGVVREMRHSQSVETIALAQLKQGRDSRSDPYMGLLKLPTKRAVGFLDIGEKGWTAVARYLVEKCPPNLRSLGSGFGVAFLYKKGFKREAFVLVRFRDVLSRIMELPRDLCGDSVTDNDVFNFLRSDRPKIMLRNGRLVEESKEFMFSPRRRLDRNGSSLEEGAEVVDERNLQAKRDADAQARMKTDADMMPAYRASLYNQVSSVSSVSSIGTEDEASVLSSLPSNSSSSEPDAGAGTAGSHVGVAKSDKDSNGDPDDTEESKRDAPVEVEEGWQEEQPKEAAGIEIANPGKRPAKRPAARPVNRMASRPAEPSDRPDTSSPQPRSLARPSMKTSPRPEVKPRSLMRSSSPGAEY
uniref:Uncharacterized protein n=1 Tax=Phaeomonas parva TaxID=124430 RepID=A0A6U4IS62_9STRA|mmetsp:Transcript_40890/g.128127  ORF Transcript_40890/g.128127 Transcript_40890/m.128127 type:complete len:679 (+) Transcript_40890:217-2253(+)